MTENDIYKKLCKIPNFYWQRIESTTSSGIPDLNGIHNGIEFWVELKIGIPRLRPAQVAWHTKAKAQGRRVFILSSYEEGYTLWKGITYKPIGQGHLTPTNRPLIMSPGLEDITPYLTTT